MSSEKTQPANRVESIVRQRYQDEYDACKEAGWFLQQAFDKCKGTDLVLKWWNLVDDDGQMGCVMHNGTIAAQVSIVRDDMNWSVLSGVSFV
jgi:hypothetical protein